MGAAAGMRDSRGADRCRTACVRPRENAAVLLAPGYDRQLPRLAEVPTIPGVRASPEFIGRSRLFYCAHDGPMIGQNRYGTEFVIDSVRHCRIVMPIFFEQGDHLGGLLVVQNRTLENQPLALADELIFPPFPGKNTRLSRGLLQADGRKYTRMQRAASAIPPQFRAAAYVAASGLCRRRPVPLGPFALNSSSVWPRTDRVRNKSVGIRTATTSAPIHMVS